MSYMHNKGIDPRVIAKALREVKDVNKYNKAIEYVTDISSRTLKLQHTLGAKYPLSDVNSLEPRYKINVDSLRQTKKELKDIIIHTKAVAFNSTGNIKEGSLKTVDYIEDMLNFIDKYEKLLEIAKKENKSVIDFALDLDCVVNYNNPLLMPHLRGIFVNRHTLVEMYNHYKWYNTTRKAYRMNVEWSNFVLNSLTRDMNLSILDNLPYDSFVMCLIGSRETDNLTMYVDLDRKTKRVYINTRSYASQPDADGDYIEGVGAIDFRYDLKLGEVLKTVTYTYTNDNTLPSTTFNPSLRSFYHMSYYDNETEGMYVLGQDQNYCRHGELDGFTNSEPCRFEYGIYQIGVFGDPMVLQEPYKSEEEDQVDALGFQYLSELAENRQGTSLSIIMSSLVYLATENALAEIKKTEKLQQKESRKIEENTVKPHKNNNNKKHKKTVTNSIKSVDVAVRETEFFIKMRDTAKTTSTGTTEKGTGTKKRKHIRKGHYHSYWVGKRDSEDRKLILKFLMPMLIGKDNEGELDINLMNVNIEKQVKEVSGENDL